MSMAFSITKIIDDITSILVTSKEMMSKMPSSVTVINKNQSLNKPDLIINRGKKIIH